MDYSSSSYNGWKEELKEMAVATFLNKFTSSRKFWIYPIDVEMDKLIFSI